MKTIASSLFFSAALSAAHIDQVVLEGFPDGEQQAYDHVILQGISLTTQQEVLAEKLNRFVGQEVSDQMLNELKQTVVSFYSEQGYPFVIAAIPNQDTSKGRVKIKLIEGKVGTISYTGNRWFKDETLARFIHLKPQEPIHKETLLNDVTSLNRNHFHSTEIVLKRGKSAGETDVEFVTKDRFPLRVYGGADNTGLDITGKERYYAGFNWGNAWGIGDQLNYQWTTTDSPHLFNSHFLGYTSYLPWYHTLKLYGAYARIHPVMDEFRSEGQLIQGSARYDIPFKPLYTDFTSEFTVGTDFKRTNSALFFADSFESVPLMTKNVNLMQLVLGYRLEDRFDCHHVVFDTTLYGSPGAFLPDQTKRDYNSLRADARPLYAYGTATLEYEYTHRWGSCFTLFRGQAATGPLLPSEQFGLGGYDTIRGYDERQYDADNALCLNVEFRSPKVGLWSHKEKNHLIFLAFVDYGVGNDYKNQLAGIPASEWFLSAGPGIRLLMYPYLTARVDYGFQLHRVHLPDSRKFGKLHFGVTASY